MKDLEKKLLQIKDSVRRLYDAQKSLKEMQKHYEQVKQKEQLCISNFMFSNLPNGVNSFVIRLDEGLTYYENPVSVRVTKVRTQKFVWDCDRLKKNLGKRYNKIVNKTYTINDMEGLIAYLKTCGVDPKKFRKFVDVSAEVDETKVDNLSQLGEITKEDLKGCYTMNLGEPYIRLTEVVKKI